MPVGNDFNARFLAWLRLWTMCLSFGCIHRGRLGLNLQTSTSDLLTLRTKNPVSKWSLWAKQSYDVRIKEYNCCDAKQSYWYFQSVRQVKLSGATFRIDLNVGETWTLVLLWFSQAETASNCQVRVDEARPYSFAVVNFKDLAILEAY